LLLPRTRIRCSVSGSLGESTRGCGVAVIALHIALHCLSGSSSRLCPVRFTTVRRPEQRSNG
jgi:hypothetical protein